MKPSILWRSTDKMIYLAYTLKGDFQRTKCT